MDRILIRKKIVTPGTVFKGLMKLNIGEEVSFNDLLKRFGCKQVMSELFDEVIEDCDNIISTSMFKSYEELKKKTNNENEYFIKAYKIAEDFALGLDGNIYLYHLVKEYNDDLPWLYADSKKYLGDTWWESDEEIIKNIKNKNVVDFLRDYKGY